MKSKRILDKQLSEILNEMGIYLIFLFFLYFVSFTNLSSSSFTYNQLFVSTFVENQSPDEIGLNNETFKQKIWINRNVKPFLKDSNY